MQTIDARTPEPFLIGSQLGARYSATQRSLSWRHGRRGSLGGLALAMIASLSLTGAHGPASASDVFNVDISAGTNGQTSAVQVGCSSAAAAIDTLTQGQLQTLFHTGAPPGPTVSATIDFAGLPMVVKIVPIQSKVAPAGTVDLTLTIPRVGLTRVFRGATWDGSVQQLRDFLKSGEATRQIARALAASSPVYPLAGNVGSLQWTMTWHGFNNGFFSLLHNLRDSSKSVTGAAVVAGRMYADNSATLADVHEQGGVRTSAEETGADVHSVRSGNIKSSSLYVPLNHTWNEASGSRLSWTGFLSATDSAGTRAYSGGVGINRNVRITDRWYLTPEVGIGRNYSADMLTMGHMAAASLTSLYYVPSDGWSLAIGNGIGYTHTLPVAQSGYPVNPEISNTSLTNALALSRPLHLGGSEYTLDLSVTDQRYTGTPSYDRRSDIVSAGLTWRRGINSLATGVSYINSTHSHGCTFHLGYGF